MNLREITFMAPDPRGSSWRQWQEIRHYGAWLRHIGDPGPPVKIGDVILILWNGKERQRAKEISNRYFAHSEGAPGPDGTVVVAYRYKSKTEHFSLTAKEIESLRDEVLRLVSKQLFVNFEVSCAVCGASSDGTPIDCGHLDYSGVDTDSPALFIRVPNTKVNAVIFCRSDVDRGTNFTKSILMPTLSHGPDITELKGPVAAGISTSKAWREKDRVKMPVYNADDTFTGAIKEIGLWSGDTLMIYADVSMRDRHG